MRQNTKWMVKETRLYKGCEIGSDHYAYAIDEYTRHLSQSNSQARIIKFPKNVLPKLKTRKVHGAECAEKYKHTQQGLSHLIIGNN